MKTRFTPTVNCRPGESCYEAAARWQRLHSSPCATYLAIWSRNPSPRRPEFCVPLVQISVRPGDPVSTLFRRVEDDTQ